MLSDCITIILTRCLLVQVSGVGVTSQHADSWWWLACVGLSSDIIIPPPFDVIDQYLTFLTQRTIFHQISSFIKPKTQHPQYLSDAHATLNNLNILFDPPLKYSLWGILQYRNVAMLSKILQIWHIDIDYGFLETSSHICIAPVPCVHVSILITLSINPAGVWWQQWAGHSQTWRHSNTQSGHLGWAGVGGERQYLLVLQTINRRSCTITEKAPTRAFSWLKVTTMAFTFKGLRVN